MSPREQAELLHVVFLHKRQHEPNEANAVQAEGQESMVGNEKSQRLNAIEQHSEVVEEALAVEEIVGSEKEIPGKTAEPREAMDSINLVADGDYFLETLDLYCQSLKSVKH